MPLQAPLGGWPPTPVIQQSHLVTEKFESESVMGVEEPLPVPPLFVHFSRGGGLRARGPGF